MNDLPSGWIAASIDQLRASEPNSLTDGPYGSNLKSEHYRPGGARVIRLGNIGARRYLADDEAFISLEHFALLQKHQVKSGDIIVAALGNPLGRACLVPTEIGPALVKADCFRFLPSEEMITEYLMLWLNSEDAQKKFSDSGHGLGRTRINLSDFRSTPAPVPPLPEQRRIVAKIDSLSAKSARARDHLDHIPRLVEKYKQAILAAAFRGELTSEWRPQNGPSINLKDMESARRSHWERARKKGKVARKYSVAEGIDWKPDAAIPTGWQWLSVDQLTYTIQYGTSAKTDERSDGVAVLRMGNIQRGGIDLTNLKYLPENHHEFPALLLDAGDVLFNRTNSAELVGKTAVYTGAPQKASFASYLIRLKTSGMRPELISAYINSAYGREWVANVVNQQVGQANVNGTKLSQLGVPVMPIAEQDEIVRRIETAFTWIDRLAAEATSARKLVDRLDAAVLAKAFRGELVPQDPDDEPASVLLERIRAERAAAPAKRRGRRTSSIEK